MESGQRLATVRSGGGRSLWLRVGDGTPHPTLTLAPDGHWGREFEPKKGQYSNHRPVSGPNDFAFPKKRGNQFSYFVCGDPIIRTIEHLLGSKNGWKGRLPAFGRSFWSHCGCLLYGPVPLILPLPPPPKKGNVTTREMIHRPPGRGSSGNGGRRAEGRSNQPTKSIGGGAVVN